jgi:hypothetical protein
MMEENYSVDSASEMHTTKNITKKCNNTISYLCFIIEYINVSTIMARYNPWLYLTYVERTHGLPTMLLGYDLNGRGGRLLNRL